MKPQRARRRQEEEADIIGMDLAARACYEPGAAMTLFTKLGEYERRHGVHVPKFLSTHPLSEVRCPPLPTSAAPPRRKPRARPTRAGRAQERVKKLAQHLPAARHVAELEGCQLPDENVTAELLPVGALGAAPALGPAPKAPPDASDPFAW